MLEPDRWLSPPYRDAAVVGVEVTLALFLLLAGWLLLRFLTRQLDRSAKSVKAKAAAARLRRGVNFLLASVLIVTLLGIFGINGYFFYRGGGIYHESTARLAALPPGFWRMFGLGLAKVAGLLLAACLLVAMLRRLLAGLQRRAAGWGQIKANDQSIAIFFRSLERIVRVAAWLAVLALAAWWLLLPAAVPAFLWLALRLYLIVSLGLLAVKAVAAVVDSLDAVSARFARGDRLLEFYETMRGLIPLLRRCLEYAVYVFVATLVLKQLDFIAQFAEYGPRLIQVIGIFFLARVLVEVCNLWIDRKYSSTTGLTQLEKQQQATLVPLIKSLLRTLIYFAALVLMLGALNLNPLPLLAGAGVLGVVVGFGAQTVISDLVSGFFILAESHYLVGDFVEIGDARGRVESIQLRTTRIRGTDGQQHILRNGQIDSVVTHSKSYTFAVVAVGVSFASNLDEVYEVLRRTGERLATSDPNVLEPTVVAGLEQFGASELLIRTTTRVKPGMHMQVARTLRKMIHQAFREAGVEIPYPHQVNIRGDSGPGEPEPPLPQEIPVR